VVAGPRKQVSNAGCQKNTNIKQKPGGDFHDERHIIRHVSYGIGKSGSRLRSSRSKREQIATRRGLDPALLRVQLSYRQRQQDGNFPETFTADEVAEMVDEDKKGHRSPVTIAETFTCLNAGVESIEPAFSGNSDIQR